MDLSDVLAADNRHVKAKEAEALRIIGEHSMPAMKSLDGLKRQLGHIVPKRELGMFVSPAEGELYNDGKKRATRILFDAYAEIAVRQIRDPEAFIALLGAILEKVAAVMTFPCSEPAQPAVTLIDRYEAELCRLAWIETAWERAKPGLIRIGWRRLRALFSRAPRDGRPIADPAAAAKTSRGSANIDPAIPDRLAPIAPEKISSAAEPASAASDGSDGNGTDHRAEIDAFILKVTRAGRKITRKDIWTVAGYRDATEFERFQRGDARTTGAAAEAFQGVLNLEPEGFIRRLEKKSAPK